NFIRAELGKMEQGYAVSVQQASGQPLLLPLPPRTPRAGLDGLLGREVVLGVRPEHISQRGSGLENGADHIHPLRAAVTVMEPTGADLVLRLQLGGGEVTARVEPKSRAVPGEVLDLQVDMGRAVLFDPASEVRLY
ncbi:MAG: TOBE domain-containing protein, partial [Aquisalimonadaceae bacterium]